MSFPIKAIYSSDGKTVTGLGEFTSSDTIDIDALPTGDKFTQVARGNHTHTGYAEASPSSTHAKIADKVANALTIGTTKYDGSTAVTLSLPDTSNSLISVTKATDVVANQVVLINAANSLAVKASMDTFTLVKMNNGVLAEATAGTDYAAATHTHAGYQSTIGATGLLKGGGSGAISAATPGTDFVSKDIATNFTKPQRPSFASVSLTSANPSYLWDLSTHQTIHLNIASGVAATLSLTPAPSISLLGLSYRLIISGEAASLALPSEVKWGSSAAPTLTNSASKADILTFEVMNLGVSFVLVEVGRNLSVG